MQKLNFGCGSIQPEGWINVDHDPQFNAITHLNNIEDGSLDVIVAHAVIQQIPWHSLVNKLVELKSKLKVDGVLRISLPDIITGFCEYIKGNKEWFVNSEDCVDDRFSSWLTWYSTSCSLLTKQTLVNKLHEAGFSATYTVGYKQSNYSIESPELDTREGEFYFVEAVK